MKLRQKLAVALASAMVVTAVPVITSAASTNTMVKSVIKAKKDDVFTQASTAAALRIAFDEAENKEVFYLRLTNSEWSAENVAAMQEAVQSTFKNGETIKIERQSSKVAKVTYTPGNMAGTKTTLRLPIFSKLTGGDATIAIEASGSTSTSITEGSWVYATTVEDNEVASVTIGKPSSIYTSGTIADITFDELYTGAINKTPSYAIVDLNNDDFEFDLDRDTTAAEKYNVTTKGGEVSVEPSETGDYTKYIANVEYKYGFADNQDQTLSVYVSSDKTTMVVPLQYTQEADSLGQIKLTDVKVKATTKTPEQGKLRISIDGDVTETKDAVVANIAAYGTSMNAEEAPEIVGGKQEEVTFALTENVDDSFTINRPVTFTMDKGYFMNELDTEAETAEALANMLSVKVSSDGQEAFTITGEALQGFITDIITNSDDQVIGFEMTLTQDDAHKFATAGIDEIEVTADVTVGLQEEGDITVKAEGRAIQNESSAVVAKAIKPFTVTPERAVLKVGLQDQTTGSILVAETAGDMFNAGEDLYVLLPEAKGMTFEAAPEVEVVNGDLQIDKDKTALTTVTVDGKDREAVKVRIKRASKEASTLAIKNFGITVDRTVAEGAYDVELAGEAISSIPNDTMNLEDFIVIGTPNTEDVAGANGLAKGTSTFVIGKASYTMNGKEVAMDAASYIQDPGYTMIPVRYVAEAFGVSPQDILFSNGTATIFAGTRTVQLTNNSNVAKVNGASITMGTKVEIKDGRTYAPVGEVARILGVSTSWDNQTKTATFTNN